MKAELVNPFVQNVSKTFQVMFGMEAKKTSMALKTGKAQDYALSVFSGFFGGGFYSAMLGFSEGAAQTLSTEFGGGNLDAESEICDAYCEVMNNILGGTKTELETLGLKLFYLPPHVIFGGPHHFWLRSDVPCLQIGFQIPAGAMTLELNLMV